MPGATRAYRDRAGNIILDGITTVRVNNMPIAFRGAPVLFHGRRRHAAPRMVQGSSTVRAGGRSVCRQGDVASCGHRATGSATVYIGG
jgi:uncharacterized Zn-binding protein involved in type VI secretion